MRSTLVRMTTIKSAVFEPENQRFWISTRQESPMGLGEFMEVNLDRFWDSREEDLAAQPRLSGYQPKSPELLEGIRRYREAYRAWHMENHRPDYAEVTLDCLRKTLEAFPEDGNIWLQTGMVALKLHRFEEASRCFERAKSLPLAKHITEVCNLYLARCHDLNGERSKAMALYQRFTQVEEPRLRKAFRKGLRKRYSPRETAKMMLDLQLPDALQY